MSDSAPAHSWFGPPVLDLAVEAPDESQEFARLWQAFMTARLTLGLVLVLLQVALFATGTSHSTPMMAISMAYFVGTLLTRLRIKPRRLGQSFNRAWGVVVGLDVLAFTVMQWLQDNSINYTPLFALPILLASVLGSLRLALGTAAGVTVLLLGSTLSIYLRSPADAASYFVQSALSGVGYFAIAFLSNQLSTRLANEGQRARHNQRAARIQRVVNELVIESLPDGVLIVDDQGRVRAANPAARQLLGMQRALHSSTFDLRDEVSWQPLLKLMRLSVGTGRSQEEDVTLHHAGHGPRRMRVRTRLAAPLDREGDSLCVLFLQDQREIEARMRTEKLASMGRLSTAVAHEIRNPLAAIAQANALLDEDISDPKLKRLTLMVGQNTKRLEKIVEDILHVAHVQPPERTLTAPRLALNESVYQVCQDWAEQSASTLRLLTDLPDAGVWVRFDAEQLRRVLVNLLDNARRYASDRAGAIQVSSRCDAQQAVVAVWSDGAPMDQSVERHLFEPFFSSESRSSGLGLFICRELCESHGASIVYQRNSRPVGGKTTDGNEFAVTLSLTALSQNAQANPTTAPWQTTLC